MNNSAEPLPDNPEQLKELITQLQAQISHKADQAKKLNPEQRLELRQQYALPILKDLDQYLTEIDRVNVDQELAYELFKVSDLRELKRKRFLRALFASGIAFIVLFVGQLLRILLGSPS